MHILMFCVNCTLPFNALEDISVPIDRNFNSILMKGSSKYSYESRDYESVNEKSLS